MATPVGHGIVGYALARAAGVSSRRGMALAIGAASLPDVDFLLGYVANGDVMSLHHEVITHKPAFPALVGAATGVAAVALSVLRGRVPAPRDVLRPAALATALVGSHIVMDPLPLPYASTTPRSGTLAEVVAAQAWNAVIDMAIYGTLAVLAFERNGANGPAVAKA
ncbi:MAG: hypothetical protein Q8S13_07635 [Dehalococcoidia bacterium]|nr:hypothetical protein [Dehalococcoidia bacterium]